MKTHMLIKIHATRAMYDWHGWLQWRPKSGKPTTWYVMHQGAIEPLSMRDRFQECIEEMLSYGTEYEVIGEWVKERKTMIVESLVGLVEKEVTVGSPQDGIDSDPENSR